jgi:hypothetical protein
MAKALENDLLPRNEVKPSNLARNLKLILRIAVAGIVLIGLAIRFVPYGRAHDNPPVIAEPRWDSAQTRALFARACMARCLSASTPCFIHRLACPPLKSRRYWRGSLRPLAMKVKVKRARGMINSVFFVFALIAVVLVRIFERKGTKPQTVP